MKENNETTKRKEAATPAAPKKRKRTRGGDDEIHARIAALLDAFEQQIRDQTVKVSVSDYIRLLQLKREFDEQKPKEIEVTWVDSLGEKNASEK